jgi:alpha,alpha-trehalase
MGRTYERLEHYGIVGNLITTAHICSNGSIDWLCFPRVNSPSVFARLLDAGKGGHLGLKPVGKFESLQSYIPETNILETTFRTATGSIKLTDFMYPAGNGNETLHGLFRKITGIEGFVSCELSFMPRFNYARDIPRMETDNNGIKASGAKERLYLQTGIQCRVDNNTARGEATYRKGNEDWLVLSYNDDRKFTNDQCRQLLIETETFWKNWVDRRTPSQIRYDEWEDIILRSGLALKLLINTRSGAIIAAPTTSLPEDLGGVRNWDYRFAWIRDGVFTIQALFHLGLHEELNKFREWIDSVISGAKTPGDLRPVYGIFPEDILTESTLEHFSGYKNSRPVRIGNNAAEQLQLDIIGELVNVLYESCQYGFAVPAEQWPLIRGLVDHLCGNWMKEDSGIWEVRGPRRHFVYSKMMCWVALDRALKTARKFHFPFPGGRWIQTRRDIRKTVLSEGYSEKMGSFRRSFGSDTVDATGLMTGIVGFLPSDDPRVVGTIDRIMEKLVVDECLVYRYKEDDGLPGNDNPFLPCSFWLVKAFALCGRIEEAQNIFTKLLGYASPLGLFSEEVSPRTRCLLGNFPQAFSHLGLINSAIYLAAVTKDSATHLAGMPDSEDPD